MVLELILRKDNQEISRLSLGTGEYVIGRDPSCEVVVPSDVVSRRHARLTVSDGDVFIQDLGSANGTFIDGRRAEGRRRLAQGQRVDIGLVVLEARWSATSLNRMPTLDDTSSHAAESVEKMLKGQKYMRGDVVAVGGMGEIRKMRDQYVRRSVAMKLMSPEAVKTPSKRLRFIEEAQVTGQLEHPNIVPVYDLGLDSEGHPFYTMKFVRGLTLHAVLDDIRHGKRDTIAQFPLGRLLTILQKACDAIGFAHSKGVIHRDIKPENIMIGDFGEVLVMDWGIAKKLSGVTTTALPSDSIDSTGSSTSAYRTRDGAVMGTPHFMSPEQAAGRNDQIDPRTDIFMLGGVLYNILTLTPPFPGDTTTEVLRKVWVGAITPPLQFNRQSPDRPVLSHCPGGQIPESLAAVAMKALSSDPSHRYATVRELQNDIEAYHTGFATTAERAGMFKQFVLLMKRRKVEFSLIGMTAAALLLVGGVSLTGIIRSEHNARQSLESLRLAAPAYASQAESLIDQYRFGEALGKVNTAIELMPERAKFFVLKGHIMQSLLRVADARTAYEGALKLEPGNAIAKQNLQLCDKLLADNEGRDELSPASLNELQVAMIRQQRSSEALAMLRRLGKETQALHDTWKTILETEHLIEKSRISPRLIVDDAGLFYLNLNRTSTDSIAALKKMPLKELHLMLTEVRDLNPIKDAPLTLLNVAGTPVSDLEPLRGMPLKAIVLAGCKNLTDLTPLADCTNLETVVLPPNPGDLECLRDLPNLKRIGAAHRFGAEREDLMRRFGRVDRQGQALPALLEETQPAVDFWKDYDDKRKPR